MKRLIKKNYHDTINRDSAMIYINDQFIIGYTHAECVNKYFKENRIRFKANIDHIDDRTDVDYELDKNEKANNLPFACINISGYDAFIEKDTLKNISISELANKLKQQFPEYTVYEDIDDYTDNMSDYRKLAKKIRGELNVN